MTTKAHPLQEEIERYFAAGADAIGDIRAMDAFLALRAARSGGKVRAAQPDSNSEIGWKVNPWVKQGILLGFRLGKLAAMGGGDALSFIDKHTFPPRHFSLDDGLRLVPGGSAVREGAYLAPGVVCMPPMYV